MEDQRNWTDASFKTYSTPLSEPFPRLVRTGDLVEQSLGVAGGKLGRAIEIEVRTAEEAPGADRWLIARNAHGENGDPSATRTV